MLVNLNGAKRYQRKIVAQKWLKDSEKLDNEVSFYNLKTCYVSLGNFLK